MIWILLCVVLPGALCLFVVGWLVLWFAMDLAEKMDRIERKREDDWN